MASNGIPTTYAGLSQWKLSDKPDMEDFNEDNQRIDGKLYEHGRELDAVGGALAPIIEYPIPLVEGCKVWGDVKTVYSKNAFGEVLLTGSVASVAETFALPSATIGQLPEGYRPSGQIRGLALLWPLKGSDLVVRHLSVLKNGEIQTSIPPGTYKIEFQLSFLAAQ